MKTRTYNYFKHYNEIICVTSYHGKSVKGKAKCNPDDTFSEEIGKQLAKVRCDKKLSQKILKNAKNHLVECTVEMNRADKKFNSVYDFMNIMEAEYEETCACEQTLLHSINKGN